MSNKYILFYSTYDEYGFFSNFYKAKIIVNGIEYCCNEQYIMHQKAMLFKDTENANKIMGTTDPSRMKGYGRKVKGFDENKWIKERDRIAYECNFAKFNQHDDLKKKLIATGNATLAEAAPNDAIWGIGVDKVVGKDVTKWRGLNILGNTLMKVRFCLSQN